MPEAFGNDRVTSLPDGRIEVTSTVDKGWKGRREKTNTTGEFPGTPVQWDESWYEVLAVRRLTDGARVYVLHKWPERHTIRNPSRYDDESERIRHAEAEKTVARQKSSRGIAVAGLLIGHAPSHAQLEIEREYGFSAVALSLLSLILPLAFAVWVAARLPIRSLPPPYASPAAVAVGGLLLLESMIRLILVLSRSHPYGSVAGLIGYELWRMTTLSGRAFEARAAVKADARLRTASDREADAATLERDEYSLREPFLSLLSPSEQQALHRTFGFNVRMWGVRTALVIGIFSALGVWSSGVKILGSRATLWTWSSLIVATLLLAEQLKRLTSILDGRPAGSVLGGLVRPWCRRLLLAKPKALKEGTVQAAPPVLPDVWEGDVPPDDHTGR